MTEQSKQTTQKTRMLSKESIRNMPWKAQIYLPVPFLLASIVASIVFHENVSLAILYSLLGYMLPFIGIHFAILQLRDTRIVELEKEIEEKSKMLSTKLHKEVERISNFSQTYTGNIKKDGKDSITTLINHLAHISYSQCTSCLSCEHVKNCQNLLFRYLHADCTNLSESIDLVNDGQYKITTNSHNVHDLAVEHWLASAPAGNGEYLVVHFLDPTAKQYPRNDYDDTDVYFFRSVVTNLLKEEFSGKSVKWLFVGDIDNDFQYCYDYIPRVFWEQKVYTLDNDPDVDKKRISRRENQLKKHFRFKYIPKAAFDIIVPGGDKNREIYSNYIKKEYPNIGIFGSNCVFVDSNWDKGIEHGYVFCNDDVQTLAGIFNDYLWDSINAKDIDWNSIKEKFKTLISKTEDRTEA